MKKVNRQCKWPAAGTLFFNAVIALFLLALAGCAVEEHPVESIKEQVDSCSALATPRSVQLESKPGWQSTESLPRYCRVRGTIANRIKFELRLPEQWNGRFLMAGCGGFCGTLLPDKPGYSNSINEALKRGYAAISHDGGHQAQSWETHWAYDDPQALELWAHKVLPTVSEAGVAMTTAFYDQEPHRKYFSGCSNGGRLGLMAAQRYPDLFDGIAAGGAIFDLHGIAGLWGNWMIGLSTRSKKPVLATEKVALIKPLVMAQCDGVDGQVDNIITEPRACKVDFKALQCSASPSEKTCLTTAEADMLNRLYGGVRNGKDEVVYPALAYGSEHYSDLWLFGSETKPGWGVQASTGYRQLLSNDLFDKDAPAAIPTDEMLGWIERSSIPALTDAVDPDLSGLVKSNTKLLIYQGWSDPLIIPEPIIKYYDRAVERAGGLQELQAHARLFMVPGMGHCWERPAESPALFDPLLAIERWVEGDGAPEFVVARQEGAEGQLVRTRPVCAYPKIAKLIEGENPDEAAGYRCGVAD